jgi:hypothetical protein
MLNAAHWEQLYEKWEQTDRALESQRYPDQASFANVEQQRGKAMWSKELVSRVIRLNNALFVEDSLGMPGYAAFYTVRQGIKVPCGAAFKKGYLTEFAVIYPDAADLPVRYEPGWRTVLMRLVQFKALTKKQVLETWGDVYHNDARGKHWHLWLKDFN